MGCVRAVPIAQSPPSVASDETVRDSFAPSQPSLVVNPPRTAPALLPGIAADNCQDCSQVNLPKAPAQLSLPPCPPEVPPPCAASLESESLHGLPPDSLYALALRERHEHTRAQPFGQSPGATKEEPNCKLWESFSCVHGDLGVRRLSLSRDYSLSSTATFSQAQSPTNVVRGEQLKWVRGEVLGQGSLGRVFSALDQSNGSVIAVKEVVIDQSDESDLMFRGTLEHEIDIMRELKHPHIVSYLGNDYLDGSLYVYLEYVPGGSLQHVLLQFGAFDECLLAVYSRELLEGLQYLHTRAPPVIHRDIKSSNVLVGLDCKVKLSDFGCSKRQQGSTLAKTMKGSIPWMAPEVIIRAGYGTAADVWSFGCVVIEMASAKPPWGKFDNPVTACFRIGMSEELPPMPESVSVSCADFIKSCVRRDPIVRLSPCELLLHKFVSDLHDGSAERRGTEKYLETTPDYEDLRDLLPEYVD